MYILPVDLINFCIWWLLKAPKKIHTILKRVALLINNEISFTLNLRLFFTPLYGDYTRVGRLIGFFVRVLEVIFGLVLVGVILLLSLISVLAWWAAPFYLFIKIKFLIIPLIFLTYVIWEAHNSKTPKYKSKDVSGKEIINTFKPKTKIHFELLSDQGFGYLSQLFSDPQISFLFRKVELKSVELLNKLAGAPQVNNFDVASAAHRLSIKYKCRYVETEHLFYAFLANIPKIDQILSTYGSSLQSIESTVDWIVRPREDASRKHFWQDDYVMPPMGGIGKGLTGRVTPELNSISEDFTKKAKYTRSDNYIIHEKEIQKIAEILSGSKVNVLIIGEPGSGKTSVVRNIAYKVIKGTEFGSLKFKRIISLESGSLIAGTKTPGDLALRFKKIMDEAEKSGDIILFIDEIHNLVASSGDQNGELSSAFSILEPHLSSGRIQFIGATNIENYRKYIEPNGAFSRLFNIIERPPETKEETLEVVKNFGRDLEKTYDITITMPALKKIIDLSDKLMHDRVFPDKGIDILNRTVVSVVKTTKYLTAEEAAREISEMTHIPVTAISEDESEKLLNIENEMKQRVIGQDQAITQIGKALKRARVGIRNENKPIASFLFVGTTGVGKTETAKALAMTYFGNEKTMIRVDMSEYQQLDSINRLIGTPDGRSKGILTEAVRSAPFALILLDEIEKAHPNILLLFLQVLDDGRITDSTGRVIDFTNTIIIATSNVGTKAIQEISNRNGLFEEMQEVAMNEVREKFAPEFLNRFNGIIVFRPLNMDSLQKITLLQLGRIKKTAEEKGISVFFKPELINELISRGYNPQWGARPLSRVIEDTVESYLAVKMISKEFKMGDRVSLGLEVFNQ